MRARWPVALAVALWAAAFGLDRGIHRLFQFQARAGIIGVPNLEIRRILRNTVTLHPGDVIWMGTDGVSPDLKHGDVVDIEITGIGHLTNPFIREGA